MPLLMRVLHGMTFAAWIRLLARYRFRVSPAHYGSMLSISLTALGNSLAALMQRMLFERRLTGETILPPVFIIGNMRTGTSFLYELMITDRRFLFARLVECIAPNSFMIATRFVRRSFKLPPSRPMDAMQLNWDRPLEDEFALLNVGVRTPDEFFMFPDDCLRRPVPADPRRLPAAECEAWKEALIRFLKCVSLQRRMYRRAPVRGRHIEPKWLLLKSPMHTARIALLNAMFPGARFIHLVRNPYAMFASNMKMQATMLASQTMQTLPDDASTAARLEDEVFERLNRIYQDFDSAVAELAPGQFCEVRYETLVSEPLTELARIYRELGLGEFSSGEAAVNEMISPNANYQTNRYALDQATLDRIAARWSWYFDRFGYDRDPRPGVAPPPLLARSSR
jgi:hypothetical protein